MVARIVTHSPDPSYVAAWSLPLSHIALLKTLSVLEVLPMIKPFSSILYICSGSICYSLVLECQNKKWCSYFPSKSAWYPLRSIPVVAFATNSFLWRRRKLDAHQRLTVFSAKVEAQPWTTPLRGVITRLHYRLICDISLYSCAGVSACWLMPLTVRNRFLAWCLQASLVRSTQCFAVFFYMKFFLLMLAIQFL